jgi:hypothetical protein
MSTPTTYVLTGMDNFLSMSGSNDLVFVLAPTNSYTAIVGDGKELTVDIGKNGGNVAISGFKGVIGLDPSLGFTSAKDALRHVVSDEHGGSLLAYSGGFVDLAGVAPHALKAANFHIDTFHFAPFGN